MTGDSTTSVPFADKNIKLTAGAALVCVTLRRQNKLPALSKAKSDKALFLLEDCTLNSDPPVTSKLLLSVIVLTFNALALVVFTLNKITF